MVAGLRAFTPEICDELASLAGPLWEATDALPASGRVLFAAHRDWPRPADDDLLSAWLAVNAIREFRGDTHWAIQIAEELSGPMAGILDNAFRSYDGDWIPRSRGADDAALNDAYRQLEERGLAVDGAVNDAGIAYRHELEDRLDRMTIPAWQALGADRTRQLVELLEPVSDRYIDADRRHRRCQLDAGGSHPALGSVRPMPAAGPVSLSCAA